MFNNFNLNDSEVTKILEDYNNLIMKQCKLNHKIDEDLLQEIRLKVYLYLTKNRKR